MHSIPSSRATIRGCAYLLPIRREWPSRETARLMGGKRTRTLPVPPFTKYIRPASVRPPHPRRRRSRPPPGRCAPSSGPSGGAAPEVVSATPILGGVHREDPPAPPPLLRPHHGIGRQPVVGMDDVEGGAHVVRRGEEVLHECPAHILDLVDEVRPELEGAAVIPDPVNPLQGPAACGCGSGQADDPLARMQQGDGQRQPATEIARGQVA